MKNDTDLWLPGWISDQAIINGYEQWLVVMIMIAYEVHRPDDWKKKKHCCTYSL